MITYRAQVGGPGSLPCGTTGTGFLIPAAVQSDAIWQDGRLDKVAGATLVMTNPRTDGTPSATTSYRPPTSIEHGH